VLVGLYFSRRNEVLMYCQNCGSVLSDGARFCESCGTPKSPAPPPIPPTAGTLQRHAETKGQPRSKLIWLVPAGIVVLVVIVGIIVGSSDKTPSTAEQNPTSNAAPEPQVIRQTVPPPKFQIYRYKPDGISPVSIVVPANTTDEQLRSLLWLFREKARSHQLKDIGLKNERDGILLVYRGKRCADENIHVTVNAGPCGDGDHDDALYQWGIEGDYDKDSGSVRDTVIFDYKDGWHPGS
jgi:zinc ribbon protein